MEHRTFLWRWMAILVFLFPFQVKIYRPLKSLSRSWIDPGWHLPLYFERYADVKVVEIVVLFFMGAVFYTLFYKRPWKKMEWGIEQTALTAFLLMAGLSIALSPYWTYPLSYWKWGQLIVGAALFYATASLKPLHLSRDHPFHKKVRLLAIGVVMSGVFECAIALPQYFLQRPVGLHFLGEISPSSKEEERAYVWLPRKGLTSFDYYLNPVQQKTVLVRASGTLPHANILGGFLMVSLVMSCFLYDTSSSKKWIGGAILLQLLTLFTTYSRGALFAFGGGVLLWGVIGFFQNKKPPSFVKLVGWGLLLSTAVFFPQLLHRGGIVSYNSLAQASDAGRRALQKEAVQIIRRHPLKGVGYSHYLLAAPRKPHEISLPVHNIYLLLAAEVGGVGLVFFLLFCLALLVKGWSRRATIEGQTCWILFLMLLAVGMIDYYPLVFPQIRFPFFVVAGLISALSSPIPQRLKKTANALEGGGALS